MTKRIKRDKAYEIVLTIKDDSFIRPPKDAQRNAVLNRALKEFTDDLTHLDRQAAAFVAGELQPGLDDDRTQRELSDVEIMEDWQIPIMQAMAKAVSGRGKEVLEIGYGRGISAAMIQDLGVRSHTIIECNDQVVTDRFLPWKASLDGRDIRLAHGLWQDVIDDMGQFDGIFFHTYPLTTEEYMTYVHESVTFAEHFFTTAAAHLKPGGVFTYFSNEIDSLSRGHQRALLARFSSFSVQIVPLQVPENVMDTWWSNSMAVVSAVR